MDLKLWEYIFEMFNYKIRQKKSIFSKLQTLTPPLNLLRFNTSNKNKSKKWTGTTYLMHQKDFPNLLVGKSRQSWTAYALGQSSFLKKSERKDLEFSTWSWENDFDNLCPSLFEKIGFSFFKKKLTSFSRDKSKFFVQSISLFKLAKLHFYF